MNILNINEYLSIIEYCDFSDGVNKKRVVLYR